MHILAVNIGSSTLKFALYPRRGAGVGPARLRGSAEGLGIGGTPRMQWRGTSEAGECPLPAQDDRFEAAIGALVDLLRRQIGGAGLAAIAHRVVHGGSEHHGAARVDDALLVSLAQWNALAPLHQPHNLAGIRRMREAFPSMPQFASFDTAFHASLPDLETRFALPAALRERGIRRFGFHGLSYRYVSSVVQRRSARADGRLIMAHLGSGASLCGAIDGVSRATTMGCSALDGLVMGTRSGAVDPGVLLYLLDKGWSRACLERLLYRESGLLGVSGISADLRVLRTDTRPRAKLAIDLFTYRVVRESGAIAACLGGVDIYAFTGGIGEHDAALRAAVCERLGFLGLRIDADANAAADGRAVARIDSAGSHVEIWVIPTDEGSVAAAEAAALLTRDARPLDTSVPD